MSKVIRKILLIVLLCLFIPFWELTFAPYFLQIPDDFTYEAGLLSIDNFYDEALKAYSGEQISRTDFSYNVIETRDDVLLMENIFNVFTFEGERIISLRRVYGIDRNTGRHVYGYGDKNRTGYLFGPKFLEEGQNFDYWHVNYDAPAKLDFVSVEEINGLKTFKYETYYNNFEIDQTDNLTNLPGVPESRGVVLEPYLQLWFEPVTGMLVKYKDDTTAYYYDIETGEIESPWNKFGNEYSESSVDGKVVEITFLKYKFLGVKYGVPIVFLILALTVLIYLLKDYLWAKNLDLSEVKQNRVVLLVFVGVVGVVLGVLLYQYSLVNQDTKNSFRVAVPLLRESESTEIAIKSFKERLARNGFIEGENVFYEEVLEPDERKYTQLVRTFVKRDDIDMFYSLTTTATQLIKNETDNIPIVFNLVTHPIEVGLIDSYENSGNNLVGVRYYVPIDTVWFEFDQILANNSDISFDRVVVLRSDNSDNSQAQSDEVKEYFLGRDEEFVEVVLTKEDEIEPKLLNELDKGDAVFVTCDGRLINYGAKVMEVAKSKNVPVISCLQGYIDDGALMSVDVDVQESAYIAGDKAALILLGAKPSWMETELPRYRSITLSLEAAESLNMEFPEKFLENSSVYNLEE